MAEKKMDNEGFQLTTIDAGKYWPLCPHCEKELSIIDQFPINNFKEIAYACPLCHKIISIGKI